MIYLKSFSLRQALSIGIAVLIAILCYHWFSFSKEGWIFLTAFLVGQTTRGAPLRQASIYFLNIMIAVLVSTLLWISLKNHNFIFALLAILFIINGYILFITRPQHNKGIYLGLFFFLVFLIAVFSPATTTALLHDRFLDVIMGTLISIFCGQILFPVSIINEFNKGITPILQALINYSQTMMANVSEREVTKLNKDKALVEAALQTPLGVYPNWVYEVGFNPGLRAGLRFFLINLERVIEIFFSMHYLISQQLDVATLKNLAHEIAITMQKNQELLDVLLEFFQHKKLKSFASDFTSDIAELEAALHRVVPDNLELLDVSPDYLTLTAFVRDLKDLRQLLLQLVTALPTLSPN